uniref:Reverse transcriptase domain-containing protein n=1 Tax=Tanacetum cinerariifolium TaxID=118510 RepID=A0A699GUC6_TANCI|nr:reverse transcriptase domain-containing protein [Tanacetum cinerariifolium]
MNMVMHLYEVVLVDNDMARSLASERLEANVNLKKADAWHAEELEEDFCDGKDSFLGYNLPVLEERVILALQILRKLKSNGYSEKDKNEAKKDKTEHGMEKREKSKSTKSNSTEVKVKDGAKTEEILNGPTLGESSPNPTTSNPKHRNRRRSKQPYILEESPLDTMADQRTMAELLHAPTEGYAEVIVVPPILVEHIELKHSLINMMTSDQFFRLKKDNLLETCKVSVTP